MWSHHEGVSWDWTPQTWKWSPAKGRWSPSYGAPHGSVRLNVSTEGVEPSQAYDYWRETVFYYFAADRRPHEVKPFHARANVLIIPRGEFRLYKSDAISGSRTRRQVNADGGDNVDLGIVLAGTRVHREGRAETISRAGEFFAYDSARPSHVLWTAHKGLHLTLRRAELVGELGRDVPSPAEVARALQSSRSSAFLRSQLKLLARQLDALAATERQLLLDHAITLALALLHQVIGVQRQSERSRAFLFDAAKALIARRLDDPNLDTAMIADALGCSRSTLYRAFADHSRTVFGYIQELRLQRAKELLEVSTPGVTVAQIGESLGYTNPSNFGRAFRRRFGRAPGELANFGKPPRT